MTDTDPIPVPVVEEPQAIEPKRPKRKKRPLWVRVIKWLAIACVAMVLLVVGLISLVVWTLIPERLTPLVNKYASEYLLADVEAKRVELTFWSTFPRFSVTVDSLQLTSRTLRSLPDSVRTTLPADADSLLFLRRFSGGINLTDLAAGNISLYDVDFSDIRANLVQVDSLTANYLIVPPSEPDTLPAKPLEIPDIAINSFTITDGMGARYRSLPDSLDAALRLDRLALVDSVSEKPLYTLSLSGDASARLIPVKIPSTPFAVDGNIAWESKKPLEVELDDFRVSVGEVAALFSTSIDLNNDFTLRTLTASLPKVQVMKIVDILPDEYKAFAKGLDTDLSIYLSAKLLKPYVPGGKELPMVDAALKLAAGKLNYDRLHLTALDLDVAAIVDGNNLDATTIRLNNLSATGKAIDFTLKGTVANPVTDPLIDAVFNGSVTLQNLPSSLLDKLPCALRGTLQGDADIHTRLSYLDPKLFFRSKINGALRLSDFRMVMTDGSMEAYMRSAEFKLGSSSNIPVQDHVIDSMLTASLTIDTVALSSPGVTLSGSTLSAGVGARNIASSSDTTQINPIGASIKAHRLMLRSDSDSLRFRLRDAEVSASLQRFNSDARAPLMKALVKAAALGYADRFNRAALRQAELDLQCHPRSRPQMSAARKARFDSIAAAHPQLSSDSIMGLMRAEMRSKIAAYDRSRSGREDIEVDLDNSIHSLLRRWNASGSLRTKSGRLFTPYFPSRNSLRNLDLTFSTDSVVLKNTRLKMNSSDFTLNGSIHNITRALLSRHGYPFEFDFSVKSDTIDVNDLTATMLRGAVFADKISAGTMQMIRDDGATENDIDRMQSQLDAEVPDTARAAVIIPSNLNGNFSLKANHVRYADLWLDGLDGLVQIYDGALNLDRLRAYTSIGAVNFSALYSAPTANDLSVAAAVRIRRLNLRSVLDMMPQIDSLLPLLGEVRGVVDADLALTTRLDSIMDIVIPSLDLALKISGDSLQLLDNETFRTIAKWMLFKQKQRNMIDHMDVELAIHDGYIDVYPFIFDMDRYRLGVRGSNDAALNLDYHVAVIKSPIPFKFGINIKGTPENMKIRLGKARINEKTVAESRQITDTVRVNLINEITQVFKRGVRATGSRGLKLQDMRAPGSGAASVATSEEKDDNFSHADSVTLIQQGLIERPAGFIMPGDTIPAPADSSSKSKKKKK